MNESVEGAAALILEARRSGRRFASSDMAVPLRNQADAYAVQDIVAVELWSRHGGRASAWKVGADSRDSVPTAAPMAAPVHASPAILSAAMLGLTIVEMELAYRFGKDLPARAEAYTLEEVCDAVESMHTAIEIVDTRLSDRDTASSIAKLADNLSNGAFVLGEGVKAWRNIDPRTLTGVFRINGKVHERVEVAHPLGNPAVLLPWWATHMSRRFESIGDAGGADRAGGVYHGGVRAGDVVTTGSLNKPVECKAGDLVVAEFPEIGIAELRLTA